MWPDGWEGSLGLEPTPELYVQHIVEVFREVKRVLRKDGTLWLNMGDGYASSPPGNKTKGVSAKSTLHGVKSNAYRETLAASVQTKRNTLAPGLKPKDLIGMPWLVAFALQADGWYLRSDIIWAKNNPMPESVTDRPTKSHEYLFLLSREPRYYYDADAIREPSSGLSGGRFGTYPEGTGRHDSRRARPTENPAGRNKRTVWTIPTQAYPEAHFATYPEKLVEPCILAGTSEKGCCPECGAPWERLTRRTREHGHVEPYGKQGQLDPQAASRRISQRIRAARLAGEPHDDALGGIETIGWQPTCAHGLEPVPCTVLDPFVGSGTTLVVAHRLGRNGIGIDISEEYIKMAEKRLSELPVGTLF